MRKRMVLLVILISVCLNTLIGCDPIYPLGRLDVKKIETISIGDTINLELIYPEGGLFVNGWKDQNIEIIEGSDIVTVSGLSITGIQSGTARIKVNATTIISEEAHPERVYSKEVEITVR